MVWDSGGSSVSMSVEGVASFLADFFEAEPKEQSLHRLGINQL